MKSIFRSEAARLGLVAWYDRVRADLTVHTGSLQVQTSWGSTHVLTAGAEDAPPLVLLHGALANSALLLRELQDLSHAFRVHAVDIVGQSALSADTRPSVSNNDYGRWLEQVMEGLGLPRAHVVAVSWGGFVAMRLAAHAPERIQRLALLVPAGMVGSLLSSHVRVGWPMTRYLLSPSQPRLRAFLAQLLTTPDEEWIGYLGDAFLAFHMNMKVPARVRSGELAGFHAPTFVLGADQDLSFPGGVLLKRAAEVFPNLQRTELLENSRHCPPTTPAFREWLARELTGFLLEGVQEGVSPGTRSNDGGA
jgi:2-hydroxy-6-oxonona-2,4-dienedioate hydrolase